MEIVKMQCEGSFVDLFSAAQSTVRVKGQSWEDNFRRLPTQLVNEAVRGSQRENKSILYGAEVRHRLRQDYGRI